MVQLFRVLTAFLLALSAPPITSAPVSSDVTLGVNFEPPTCHCSTTPGWGSPSFRPGDCRQVVSDFFHDEIIHSGDRPFEFVSLGTHPVTDLPRQYIPHKFIHGTCTLAIVPLHLFNAAELPGVPPWRLYPTSDITSYWTILKAAGNVADHCLSRLVAANSSSERTSLTFVSETGWEPVGRREAIGVFLWATASAANMRIPSVSWQNNVISGTRPQKVGNATASGKDLDVSLLESL